MTFTKSNIKKITTGMLIAIGGAILTYLSETIPNVDFGQLTPVVVSIFSILINSGRKFLSNE